MAEAKVQNSGKLLYVYVELRRAIGGVMPAGEVLDMARRLLELTDKRETIDRCGRIDERAFGAIPLDHAMRDGGWALLSDSWSQGLFGDDASDAKWQPRRSTAAHAEQYV